MSVDAAPETGDGKSGMTGVILIFVEALIAGAWAAIVWRDAHDQIDNAFDISAIQVQQVNGQATLDILLIFVVASLAIAATAAATAMSMKD